MKKEKCTNPELQHFIERRIAEHFGLSIEELKGKFGREPRRKARHCLFALLYAHYEPHPSALARLYDINHATILNSLQVVKDSLETKSYLYDDYLILNLGIKQASATVHPIQKQKMALSA